MAKQLNSAVLKVEFHNEAIELAYSNRGRFPPRMTPNVIHKGTRNAYILILKHFLGVMVRGRSCLLVADSENAYKSLVNRLTTDQIKNDLFTALDLDIVKVYKKIHLTLTFYYLLIIQRRRITHGLKSTYMLSTMKSITGCFGYTWVQQWTSKIESHNIISLGISLANIVCITTYGI